MQPVDFKPEPHQAFAAAKIEELPGVGLFYPPGQGKTVATLSGLASLLFDRFEVRRVLVVAPINVARSTWPEEVAKWRHTAPIRYSVAVGGPGKRAGAVEADTHLCFINAENVSWLEGYYSTRSGRVFPFDALVVDESTLFKNPSSKRFKSLCRLRKHFKHIVALSGTPAAQGYQDLWAQLYLLDGGERLGRYYTHFLNKYFVPSFVAGHIKSGFKLLPGASKAIEAKIKDICFFVPEKPATVPGLAVTDRFVDLGEQTLSRYRKYVREKVLELAPGYVTADNAAALSGKLAQFANGFVYDGNRTARVVHTAKLAGLGKILEEEQGPVLCFCPFIQDREAIQGAFPGLAPRILKNAADIAAWNRGETRLMLAHPKSAAHGLNLQAGGHTAVFFGLVWSVEQYQQALKRLHRRGQEEPVTVYRLLSRGTIDERISSVLACRGAVQQDLLKALQAEINGLAEAGMPDYFPPQKARW